MTPLPVCKWRRQPVGPGRHICISPRVRCNASGVADESCSTCLHRDHAAAPPPRRQCRHLGPLLRVAPIKILGRTDGAGVLSRRHACALHGECTPNTAHVELPCCMTCPQHVDKWHRRQAGQVRHLTYFLYPRGPWWRWNVEQLRQRMSLFNGRRLVTVATDGDSADRDEAAALLAGLDVEVLFVANDPAQKEMTGHMPMIEALEAYRSDADVTFYAHGKGVGSHAYGGGVRKWIEAMYTALLDYWPAVARELEAHGCVGVFRRIMSPSTAARSDWHYSGSFRWMRNQDLYSRNWRNIDRSFYGPETYPGRQFRFDEAACLFGEFAYGGVGLYLESTWASWAQASADDWYEVHAEDLQTPQLVTCILTSHAQPDLVHQAIRSVQDQTDDRWQLLVLDSGRVAAGGAFDRYAADARIAVIVTGDGQVQRPGVNDQAWKINEAWRRGLVRGDLVCHLCDDDVYQPSCFGAWLAWAAGHPDQAAWYGRADRVRLYPGGYCEPISALGLIGPGTPGHSLRTHVDGLQVCVRRQARADWPEAAELARENDGHWMEAVAAVHTIHPAEVYVGSHRNTPLSQWTR